MEQQITINHNKNVISQIWLKSSSRIITIHYDRFRYMKDYLTNYGKKDEIHQVRNDVIILDG